MSPPLSVFIPVLLLLLFPSNSLFNPEMNLKPSSSQEAPEEVFWDLLCFSSLPLKDCLLCGSAQMSSAHTWAGGRPAPCPSATAQPLPECSPPALSLFLRGRGF